MSVFSIYTLSNYHHGLKAIRGNIYNLDGSLMNCVCLGAEMFREYDHEFQFEYLSTDDRQHFQATHSAGSLGITYLGGFRFRKTHVLLRLQCSYECNQPRGLNKAVHFRSGRRHDCMLEGASVCHCVVLCCVVSVTEGKWEVSACVCMCMGEGSRWMRYFQRVG